MPVAYSSICEPGVFFFLGFIFSIDVFFLCFLTERTVFFSDGIERREESLFNCTGEEAPPCSGEEALFNCTGEEAPPCSGEEALFNFLGFDDFDQVWFGFIQPR